MGEELHLTSVASVRLLMPLAMLCFRSKSISVILVSIMNFILKLAYLYKVTEKKRLIYMYLAIVVIIYCIMWLTRTSRKKKIDSSRICSSVYIIISKKKRPVYMHIVIYNYCYMVVFCGLPGPQDKDDSARRIWIWILDIIFSHGD